MRKNIVYYNISYRKIWKLFKKVKLILAKINLKKLQNIGGDLNIILRYLFEKNYQSFNISFISLHKTIDLAEKLKLQYTFQFQTQGAFFKC